MTPLKKYHRMQTVRAIQFTGGEESGQAVVQALIARNVPARYVSEEAAAQSPTTAPPGDYVLCDSGYLKASEWACFTDQDFLVAYSDEEFQKEFEEDPQ